MPQYWRTTVWEVEPGASASGRARDVIQGLAESFLVMIVTRGLDREPGSAERSFVGPPHLVARAV